MSRIGRPSPNLSCRSCTRRTAGALARLRPLLLNPSSLPEQRSRPRPIERLGRRGVIRGEISRQPFDELLLCLVPAGHVADRAEQERPEAAAIRVGFLQQPARAEALHEYILGRIIDIGRPRHTPPPGGQVRLHHLQVDASEPLASRRVAGGRGADHRPAGGVWRGHGSYRFTSRGGGATARIRFHSIIGGPISIHESPESL